MLTTNNFNPSLAHHRSLAAAETIIIEHEKITLSQPDWDSFPDALENPPAKNTKLTEAIALHNKSVVQFSINALNTGLRCKAFDSG